MKSRKVKKPRLLPKLEPIAKSDGLSYEDLAPGYAYRCTCGHRAETKRPLESIICAKCGNQMQPTDDVPQGGLDPPPLIDRLFASQSLEEQK